MKRKEWIRIYVHCTIPDASLVFFEAVIWSYDKLGTERDVGINLHSLFVREEKSLNFP